MKSINRILALLIIATLMVGCFAINASAIGNIPIFFPQSDGKIHIQKLINDTVMEQFATDHGVTWDGSKLTLNNTSISATEIGTDPTETYYDSLIGFASDATIVIKGNCVLDGSGYPNLKTIIMGNKLTIEGDGTLTIITDQDNTMGIKCFDDLTIKGSVKIDIKNKNISMKGVKNIIFEGTPNVNCITTGNDNSIHANDEIVFKLEKGGRVHAESPYEYGAMAAASSTTIVLNNAIITEPLEGKLSPDTDDYYVVDANGNFAKKVTVEIPEYVITEVEQTANWKIGGKDGAVLTSTANNALFQSVTVDGKTLTEGTDFDRTSGSTIIKFKPAFLDKLTVGKHNVEIISKYGSAKGYLIIEDDKIVQTSDNSAVGAFVAIATFSTLAFVSLKKKEY